MGPNSLTTWGRITISTVALSTFIGALVASFLLKNDTMMSLTVGAAVANATTVVGWWLGSSSGSEKKDDIIAAQGTVDGKAPVPPPP